jgi:hypothetical protein
MEAVSTYAWRKPHKDSWVLVDARGIIRASLQWRLVWPGESWWYGQTADSHTTAIFARRKLEVAKDFLLQAVLEAAAKKRTQPKEKADGREQGVEGDARPARRARRADREDE